MGDNLRFEMVDVSYEYYGKYQHCSKAKDGMWYADCDFGIGAGCGELRKDALPSLSQDTPELISKAKQMHEAAAQRIVQAALVQPQSKRSWWRFWS